MELLSIYKQKKRDLDWVAFFLFVEYSGLEPLTSTLPVLRSTR